MVKLYNLLASWNFIARKQLVPQLALLLFLLCILPYASYAQGRIVTGKVTSSEDGSTLPGVNVLIKGTNTGAVTDIDGNYSISVSGKESVLVFSFIGYTTQEAIVGEQTKVDVRLATNVSQLNEVIVVGYGSVEKKDVTGGIAKVNTEEFNKGLINAPDKLIDGKVAGLQINSNGDPGGGSSIRLRGVSINGETPLFVVDGVPLDGGGGGVVGGRNPLNFINPSDVLDITVLKDASASAIYGARGANGVIIITTKSGKPGKMKINYDGSYSVSIFTRRPDFLSPSEFRAAIRAKAPQKIDDLGTSNTNWLDAVTQLAQSTQHNISLAGGIKKTSYYASVNYFQNQGVLRFTENKKLNLSLKLDQKLLKDNLILSLNIKNGFTNDLLGPNVIGSASSFDPTQSIYDPVNTKRGGYYQWSDALATINPVSSQNLTDNQGKTFRNLTNFSAVYKLPFVKGLSVKTNLSYDLNDGHYEGITYAEAKESQNNGGTKLVQDQTKTNLLSEYTANYKNTFDKHTIDATVGYAWQNFKTTFIQDRGDSLKSIGGSLEPTYNLQNLSQPVENRLISFFGRVNYEYNNRYILTASLRRDGSSRFGIKNRWGMFPAAAFAWRILEEKFAERLSGIFNELKFRASYGVTGNEQIGDYLYSTYYRYSIAGANYQFGNEYVPLLRPTGVDPNIKWEETVSTNIGIDAGFLDGKITGSIDYYVKNVNDLLFSIAVPAGSNLSDRVLTNIGKVKNTGVELALNIVAVDRQSFKWRIGLNTSLNKNKIVKLDNLQGEDLANFPGYESGGISGDIGQTIQRRKVGKPVDAFFVYQHKHNADGSLVLDTNGDGIQSNIEMYEDINGDGIINEKDRVLYKKPNPTVLMGITSNIVYKKFDIAFTLKGSAGNYVYNNIASGSGYFQRLTDRVNNNIHASAFETGFKTRQLFSDYYVQKASFLKLTNITVGYNFNKLPFGKLRAYITAQNVFTLSPYKGVDPEIFNGIDNNLYPRSITISAGVSATFN